MLSDYWKSFLKDVLWKTVRNAVLYSIMGGLAFALMSLVAMATLIPVNHSVGRRLVESALLFALFAVGGVVSGFLFGLSTLQRHVDRIVDAIYQSFRSMLFGSMEKLGDNTSSLSTRRLQDLVSLDAGSWLETFSANFGMAKRLYQWIARKPVKLLQESVAGEFLPAVKQMNVSMSLLEDFLKKHIGLLVRIPLQAKLKLVKYAAVGLAATALVLPLAAIRLI